MQTISDLLVEIQQLSSFVLNNKLSITDTLVLVLWIYLVH